MNHSSEIHSDALFIPLIAGASVKDPVCRMSVEAQRAAASIVRGGKTYYFCSTHCAERFHANPDKYVLEETQTPLAPRKTSGAVANGSEYTCPMHPEVREPGPGSCPKCGMALELVAPSVPAVKNEYVCPMHPEVVRSEPGSCPICGMALEPRVYSEQEEKNPELASMTLRFWVGLVLTIPVLFAAMGEFLPGAPVEKLIAPRALTCIELALATPVVLWGGWPFFVRSWHSIFNRSLNMFTLIGLGIGVAYFYSVVPR